ncbi:DNA topoisomerase IIA [Fadolivirus algeromassiliense]|jgi:DNA topoisomerase-2|uniref:DNA topoisomerase 2 n=1 Tax=Fadolivirus FV1/VV64 TaxID=3070911 RepID=A0A7D3R0V0_9VIRU|nr:DNA topoisomerase IIA [Fadolivirus algeromassiliense]QKF94001.1 DNA topoisomerase IIA [Fadolivirus FV1/VV64]
MSTNQVKGKNAKSQTIEEKYKSMTDHEHILKLPDTYIGGIEEDDIKMWVYDSQANRMVFKVIKYVPGLFKIFDEILVNSRDQTVRDSTCNEIRVTIDEANGIISIWNNGDNGIENDIHKEAGCYVAEFIFGTIRSSGNYEQKGKIVGGKNGLGAKLVNIYSSEFEVENIDKRNKTKFTQKFSENMYKRTEPVIQKLTGKITPGLKITFKPDYKRFKINGLSNDMISLFKKRVYDIAAVTNIKVFLNEEEIKIKNFEDYIKMFYEDGEVPHPPVYEICNDRWKVGVVFDSNAGYRQISYVNGICTFQGGAHVTHVLDQIVGTLHEQIMAKNKNLKIKTATIRDNLTFFIDAVIEDPGFSSQTKEFLTTKVANFGSKCEISDNFIKQLSKTGIVDEVVNFAKFRAMEDLKKTDGKKKATLKGLAKLNDAHWAGTRKSKYCTLILTEGDSAKSFAVAGTEVVGKERFGVFPLRGKLLNVREATPKQLMDNEEIKNIKQIMGLKHGKKYTDVSQLRYGRILVLTDQDYDGSHIKGLIMNFIHFFWPSLIKIKGFISSIKTPIMKTWKKSDSKRKNPVIFYTISEYQQWKEKIGDDIKLYVMPPKYYKGLGTSKYEEAKEAFTDFENKIIEYMWKEENNSDNEDENNKDNKEEDNKVILDDYDEELDDDTETKSNPGSNDDDDYDDIDKTSECYDAITLAFAKDRSNDRKKWLEKYNKTVVLENKSQHVSYYDFIHKDLIHFSNYDNERSLPSICDGLKPSLRKILYASILRKIFKEEIKVAQLAGFVSDKTGYHHGEASLQGAIVGMAQNFVGSNNINWLLPNGDFGNRCMGGKNAASARYIFTQLNELVQLAFRKEDECVYDYVDDDGTKVEPIVYAPITCNLLINGSDGIGTGFSTDILPFNPIDINKNIKLLINGKEPVDMIPWFRGFKGKVVKVNDKSFESWGVYDIIDENTIVIEELPVGTWTENYKAFLDTLVTDDAKAPKKGQLLKKYIDDCGTNSIKFTLVFLDNVLQDLVKKNEIEKKLKLINKHSTTNMHLHDTKGFIKKYDKVTDILKEYYTFRLDMYNKRKDYYTKVLENQLNILSWKIKFLEYVTTGKIIVIENKKARSKENVIQQVIDNGFPKLANDINALDDDKSYDYLTNLGIFDLTEEEKAKLKDAHIKKLDEYTKYKNTTVQEIWLGELSEYETAYNKWIDSQNEDDNDNKKKSKSKKAPAKTTGKNKTIKVATY